DVLDKVAQKWVDDTFKKMTLDDKVGQLVFTSANSTYLATETDAYDALAQKIRTLHLGGVHVFGADEPGAAMLLGNPGGGTLRADARASASLLTRLQNESARPLLVSADFEAGVGFRIAGATVTPREM